MAPVSFEADIWAVGVLIYELLGLHTPFLENTEEKMKTRVLKNRYTPLPDQFSDDLKDFISKIFT
jgi:serine/threonine protein kinase